MAQAIRGATPGVRDLLSGPLMLALACVRWEQGRIKLPEAPAELMHAALLELLSRRAPRCRDAEWAERALKELAKLAGRACPGFDLIPFKDACSAVGKASRLDALRKRSGLLFGSPGDGYQFSIRPIAEYLAGWALAKEDAAKVCQLIRDHIWDARWEQPLFWMAGELWRSERTRDLAAHLLSCIQSERARGNDDVEGTLFKRSLMWLSAAPDDASVNEPAEPVVNELLELDAAQLETLRDSVRCLPRTTRDRLAETWVNQLNNANATVRGDAARRLGRIGSDRAVHGLLAKVDPHQEPGAGVRWSAANALAEIGSGQVVDALLGLLNAKVEPYQPVQRAVAHALATIGSDRAVDALLGKLDPEQEPDPGVRACAADALAHIGSERVVDGLLARLDPENEPHEHVRAVAARALGVTGSERAVDALLAKLDPQREPDLCVRAAATASLGEIGSERAADALSGRLDPKCEPDEAARADAAVALGRIGSERHADALLARLDTEQEPDPLVRRSAAWALGHIGSERAVDPLTTSLDPKQEGEKDVRAAAADALAEIGSERAVDALLQTGWVWLAAYSCLPSGLHVFGDPDDDFVNTTNARVVQMPPDPPMDFDQPFEREWPKRFAIVEASKLKVTIDWPTAADEVTASTDTVSGHEDVAAEPGTDEAEGQNVFKCEGQFWRVRYKGKERLIRDTKGCTYLARSCCRGRGGSKKHEKKAGFCKRGLTSRTS